jgi:hypothetical protein
VSIFIQKSGNRPLYSLLQRSKVMFDDVPYDAKIDVIILMAKHISHGANI